MKKGRVLAKWFPVLAAVLLLLAGLPADGSSPPDWGAVEREAKAGGYRLITASQLWEVYQKESSRPLLVDTRQTWEFRAGHIRGSVNFPIEPTFWARLTKRSALREQLGTERDRSIVFY